MKKWNLWFETILIVINAVLGIIMLLSPMGRIDSLTSDAFTTYLFWLIILGAFQVVHSLIMGIVNWNNERIRTMIVVYWALVLVDFIIIWLGDTSAYSVVIERISILILPNLLAHFLWYISFSNRIRINVPK